MAASFLLWLPLATGFVVGPASPLTCQTGPRAVGRPVVPQISMVGTVAGEQKLRPVLLEEAYQPTDTYRFHSTIHRRAAEKMFPEEAARAAAKFALSPYTVGIGAAIICGGSGVGGAWAALPPESIGFTPRNAFAHVMTRYDML
jgi:hypothetical protein